MTIEIEYEAEKQMDLDYKTLIKKVIDQTVAHEACPYEVEVNVLLTDDDGIHKINKEQRGMDSSTDVLSFPMIEYDKPSELSRIENEKGAYFHPETGELLLGDIVISVDKVFSQAEEYGHSTERELAFLIVHSMLHLFGYDHIKEEDAKIMENRQKEILDFLKIYR